MFDISWGELLIVGAVALIVIGPKELPTVLRTVGQWIGKVRRMAAEFQGQFQEAMREAELAELKEKVESSIGDPAKGFTPYNPVDAAKNEIEKAFEEKPAATPEATPAPSDAGAAPVTPVDTAPLDDAAAARAALDGATPAQPSAPSEPPTESAAAPRGGEGRAA